MYEITKELNVGNLEGVLNMPGRVRDVQTGYAVSYGEDPLDLDRLVIITVTRFGSTDKVTVGSENKELVGKAYRDFLNATKTKDPELDTNPDYRSRS